MRHSSSRHGVALIIALIILAGLLLLGLPFLFSQSESLAGSRSLAYSQAAAVGLSNGEQLAAAAVAAGIEHHLAVDGDAWTRQHDDLDATGLMQTGGWITDNTFGLDTSSLAIGVRQARSGAWIEDEHGKLNPNFLSPRAWTILLAQLNIQDWDDDQVLDSEDHRGDPATPTTDDDGRLGLDGLATSNGDNDDGNDFGELAEALANVRFTLPGRRITHLDQLLLADPGHNTDDGPGPGSYIGPNGPVGRFGFRRPLTRAELDRLRPYLTLYTPAPGRDGLIDLGNFVAQKTYTTTQPDGTAIEDVSYILLDEDPYDFIRTGSAATWPEAHDNEDYQFSRVHGLNARDYSTSLRLDTFPAAGGVAGPTFYGEGFAISAPPRVNLHHALGPIVQALQASGTPAAKIEHIGDLSAADFLRIDPLSTGVELPPIGIASKGVISVTAGAAAADQLGHVAAERHRRTVLQAVPTQIDLEERWRAQDEFHALTVQRFTSRMVTWPKPIERVDGMRADIAFGPGPANAPVGLGVAPMPSMATGYLRQRDSTNPREATHLNIDFRVPFGADQPIPEGSLATDLLTDRRDDNTPKVSIPSANSTATSDDLRPDGLRITGSFTWHSRPPSGSDAVVGPLRPVNLLNTTSADRSLTGRHLSFWFKPHSTWETPGSYPLIEVRSPAANLGARVTANGTPGVPGSNELQNRLSVVYDRERQLLITVIAPPIIEHPVDWGPRIPFDDLSPLTSAHLDERALGDPALEAAPYLGWAAPWNRLAPLAPRQPYPDAVDLWDEAGARFTAQVSRLYKPNTIVHIMRLADPDRAVGGGTQPFFRQDRWYHFQFVYAGDGPGEVLTIIDGIVGQDVSRTPPATVDAMQTGDRLTLPVMPLVTLLPPMVQPVPSGGGAFYAVDRIEVAPVLGLQAEDLFPQRGMLLINDEYIAYEDIDGNAFLNCQRGMRQNSMTNNGDVANQWPLVQEHLPGTLVAPGGLRMPLSRGVLYRGGSDLAETLANGDPGNAFFIWGRVDHTGGSVVPADAPQDSTHLTLPLGDPGCLIDLTIDDGVPTQFPNIGIARINAQYFIYVRDLTSPGGTFRMRVVSSLETSGTAPKFICLPDFTFSPLSDITFIIPTVAEPAPDVYLVGLPLTGDDPTLPSHYKTNLDNGGEFLMQFRHPGGRIEWVDYSNIGKARDDNIGYTSAIDQYAVAVESLAGSPPPSITGFLLNRDGWGKINRGRERTDFAGKVPEQSTRLSPVSHFFPPSSPMLPVQTELGSPGHWVATGDVISLVPRVAEAGVLPIQAIVRYATTDGLDATGGNPQPDTKNEYFAFDHPLPAALNAANFEMLVWPGWSGRDLTPMNPIDGYRRAPLRLDIATPGGDPRAGVELAILSPHPTPIAPDAAAVLHATNPAQPGATIDALVGGMLDGPNNLATRRGILRARTTSGGETLTDIAQIGAIVEATHSNLFPRPFGLISIGGEVFAYRQLRRAETTSLGLNTADRDRHAVLIGRGLLDLTDPTPTVVSIGQGPTRGSEVLRPLIPVIPLPIGPVAQLSSPVVDHQFFTLDTGLHQRGQSTESIAHDTLDAPLILVCDPEGSASAATIMGLAGGARVHRTGTSSPRIFDTEYVTAPWLRGLYASNAVYPTAEGDIVIGWWPRLPSARPSVPNGDEAPYHRSRRYAWAGFPMAMHGARFDLSGLTPTPAGVVINNAASQTDDLLLIEARAAAVRDHDWTRTGLPVAFGFGTISGVSTLFTGNPDFTGREVSGAELRISWRYADEIIPNSRLDHIAEAGSRGPFISSAFLRWRAPMAILAVEEAR